MNGEFNNFYLYIQPFLPFLQRGLLSSGSRKMKLQQCQYFLQEEGNLYP